MHRRDFSNLLLAALLLESGTNASAGQTVVPGGLLRRSRGGNLTSLDPHRPLSATDMEIAADLFVGLTSINAYGSLIPGCARDWTISPDGNRYEFRLRANLTWSDGRALTAIDFVESFRRLLNPATAALLGYRYDAIRGARALRTGLGSAEELGVLAQGDNRVIFVLDHPETDLLKLLAVAYVVPMHVVKTLGREWAKPPSIVVNGPFKPVGWAQNGTLSLSSNSRWHAVKENNVTPNLHWILGIDDATRLRMFRSGELDIAQISEGAQLALARREMAGSLHTVPFYGGGWIGLNVKRSALKDIRLRRALTLAVDRRVLSDKVRALGELPTESIVPQAVSDYPQHAVPLEAQWPMARRVAAAKLLLAPLGFSQAKPLRLVAIFSSNSLTQRTFLALDAMWAPLGVRIDARSMESRAYNIALNAGVFDLMDYGPFSAVQSATSFIGRFQTGSFLNYSHYSNAEVDRLIMAAESQKDTAQRARMYLDVERILLHEVPVIPLYSGVAHYLVSARIRGWVENSGLSLPSQYLTVR